jgi:ABC-2 family transporter protein
MNWVGWRLQRTETLIAAGIVAALTLILLPSGLEMAHAYGRDGLGACLAHPTDSCSQAIDAFTARFQSTGDLVAWMTLLPGVIGVLLAAPFVLELENGTYRLAWTQSITRGRWIAGKLALLAGTAVTGAAGLTLFMVWWRTPLVHIAGRMEPSTYDSEGTVVLGYTLFALGLALAVGAVWRRAVPALVVAFGVYFASRLFVDTWLRQRLVTPVSATFGILRTTAPKALDNAWVLTQWPSDRFGNRASLPPTDRCARFLGGPKQRLQQCVAEHGGGYMHAVFQPASRFWELQAIETALFGGVALLLIAFAAWWTHERIA